MQIQGILPGYYLDFMGCFLAILGFFKIDKDTLARWLEQNEWSPENLFLGVAFVLFLHGMYRMRQERKPDRAKQVLKDLASYREYQGGASWGYGKYYNCSHINPNDTWQDLIEHVIRTTKRHDLEAHNFSEFFFLYDLSSCKEIPFPSEKAARESKIGSYFYPEQFLRVMPK